MQRIGVHARLFDHYGRSGDAFWTALTAFILLAISAVLAVVIHSAFLFVSLGPIIYEMIERPLAPASSPRNTIVANAIAILVGYSGLACFGLLHTPSTIEGGVTVVRAIEVVLALGVTAALASLIGVIHPPAGSTLLLIALGIVREPSSLVVIFTGIVVIVICGGVLNHALGIPSPRWRPSSPDQ